MLGKLNALPFLRAVVPLSALKQKNTDALLGEIVKLLPDGPRYYPADMFTDRSERFIAAELLREKILWNFEQEVPHGTGVRINKYTLDKS